MLQIDKSILTHHHAFASFECEIQDHEEFGGDRNRYILYIINDYYNDNVYLDDKET